MLHIVAIASNASCSLWTCVLVPSYTTQDDRDSLVEIEVTEVNNDTSPPPPSYSQVTPKKPVFTVTTHNGYTEECETSPPSYHSDMRLGLT